MLNVIVLAIIGFGSATAIAKVPDCSGVNRWATRMARVHLQNAGITSDARLDHAKTQVRRMASEKIGKDLYRQIHHVTFTETSGKVIEVITSNEASSEECSMSAVDVFVVTQNVGGQ